MSLTRRIITATLLSAVSTVAYTQNYPNKPVSIIVPAAPGGTTDFAGRVIADYFTRALGQTFVVENVGGGSGNVGNSRVAKAAPDGYTLLLSYSGYHVANPHMFKSPGWDLASFDPIANIVTAPHVIAVKKDLPVTDLAGLIAYAKANPGKLNYGSAGVGSIQHIGTEQLKQIAGIDMVHIPYRGAGPAMQDMLRGTLDFIMTTPSAVVGYMQEGTVKTLALAAEKRHAAMPQVPTASEAGVKGYELVAWFALYAPAGTPKEVVDKLTKLVEEATKNKDFLERVDKVGAYATYMNPTQLNAFTKKEFDYWGNVISKANIKAE